MDLFGAAESGLHVVANIFRTHDFFELGLMNQARGLLARATENQSPIASVQLAGNFFDCEQSGGIQSGHVAQAEDDYERQRAQILGGGIDFVGGAEQERSVNAEDGGVVRNVFILENVHAAVFHILVGDLGNRGGGGNAADEKQSGEDHTGFNGDGEVGEDGESEGHEPDADVGFGELEQLRNFAPLAHIVGDDHKNSSEHGQRHVANQRRCEEQDAQQSEGVNHARDRRLSARADVGGGAGGGAGGGGSPKHGRNGIGHPRAEQLACRICRRLTPAS